MFWAVYMIVARGSKGVEQERYSRKGIWKSGAKRRPYPARHCQPMKDQNDQPQQRSYQRGQKCFVGLTSLSHQVPAWLLPPPDGWELPKVQSHWGENHTASHVMCHRQVSTPMRHLDCRRNWWLDWPGQPSSLLGAQQSHVQELLGANISFMNAQGSQGWWLIDSSNVGKADPGSSLLGCYLGWTSHLR